MLYFSTNPSANILKPSSPIEHPFKLIICKFSLSKKQYFINYMLFSTEDFSLMRIISLFFGYFDSSNIYLNSFSFFSFSSFYFCLNFFNTNSFYSFISFFFYSSFLFIISRLGLARLSAYLAYNSKFYPSY